MPVLDRILRPPEGVPLQRDAGGRFLVAVIALMVFLASLFTAAAMALEGVAAQWRTGLTGTMTVEIPWQGDSADPRSRQISQRDQLLTMLRSHPDVAEATVVTEDQISDLLSPWISEEGMIADLPVPILIDVQMLGSDPQALGSVAASVAEVDPTAQTHDHQRWLRDLEAVTGVMRLAAWGVMLVSALAAVSAVASATVSGLSVHRGVIDILHLIGAHDGFIATQFQRHMVRMAVPGAALGFLAALVLMVAVSWLLSLLIAPEDAGNQGISGAEASTAVALLPELSLSLLGYLVLAAVPLGAVGITVLTARLMVLTRLARLR